MQTLQWFHLGSFPHLDALVILGLSSFRFLLVRSHLSSVSPFLSYIDGDFPNVKPTAELDAPHTSTR